MAYERTYRRKSQRRSQKRLEFDITPILDVMTMAIIFLYLQLQNSSPAGLVSKEIMLPKASSGIVAKPGINIMVSRSQIWVDQHQVLNINETDPDSIYDDESRRIVPLYDRLVSIRKQIEQTHRMTPKALSFSGQANLLVDKSIKYNYLKRVLYTCAKAGFRKYKFIISK
jgi:biopolymer transport protein ExbD